ncbi:hypothetical protein OG625_15635 [Streptomyces sp. NBC_01351]|uniref:hypothetical protein n=1 Tax=Streptomyces sp. NBC_01351 TaxID=2903833 RepID=UPI002E2F3CA8|nr:hypothetical protein [Streptomyces sp. NBC_01351]
MNLRASWVAQTGQTREDTRLTQIGATTPVDPIRARSGILPGSYTGQHRVSGFWLEGKSAMAATLYNGRAVVQGLHPQGVYPLAMIEDAVLTFADGDAQAGRIDLVCLRVYDGSYDSSNKWQAVAEVVQGTPSATPVAPPTPPLSLALYTVSVPAGTSAGKGGINWGNALTDLRVPVVSLGGILPVLGEVIPGAYPGQYQDVSGGALQRWDGSAWVSYPSALGGIAPKGTLTTASYVGQYRDTPQRVLQRWNGTAWQPAFPAPIFVESRDAGTTTSTTYTETLQGTAVTAVKTTFNAPTSGSVLLNFGARTTNAANNAAYGYTSVKVTQGATVIWEPDDERSALHGGDRPSSVSTMLRLASLTGDAPYTVTVMHRTSTAGVTTYFDNIFLRIDALF